MYHQDDRKQALDRAMCTIEAAGPKGEEPPKVNPDAMRSYGDIVNSADPVDRLARYLNGLSPHNLWKAKEAIEEYVATQNAQVRREMLEKLPERRTGRRYEWQMGFNHAVDLIRERLEQ